MIKSGFENLTKHKFDGVGQYGIPLLSPIDDLSCESFIGFNYAKTCKNPQKQGLHFFLDDYQFLRLWNTPKKYLTMITSFKYVFTPDFSTYTDFPLAVQIYNHYRKHWLGAYWQLYGMQVIPTISWSDESSYDWCFDGEPVGGVVAVSSVGTQRNKESKRLFISGYEAMMRKLHPKLVVFYGTVPEGITGNIVNISSFQQKWGT